MALPERAAFRAHKVNFDPTISWGSILTFIGYVGLFLGFIHRQNRASGERAVAYNDKFNTLDRRTAILEQKHDYMQRDAVEDRARHDREMGEIKALLEKINDKLDDKADKAGA